VPRNNLTQDQVEQDERVETISTDGMDEEDSEDLIRKDLKNDAPQTEALVKENKELKDLLGQVKNKLEEINLQNARLLYANRVLGDSSLNEQQKAKIAELVSGARSVEEAKMVYETLQKTMAGMQKQSPKSLSEVVTKRSSVILGGNRKEEHTTEPSPTYNRWATLAAINKTK
jgi:predicted nuclease with TOPRIM domain